MPVFNRAYLLDQVLDRLAENTTYENVELCAVDDGSTDESPQILRRFAASGRFPTVRVLENQGKGAIAALNTALNAATGEFCVQLDDDVTVETSGWIERFLEFMELDESVGVVSAKVVFDSGKIHCCGVDVIGPDGWHERGTEPSEPIGRRMWINRVKGHPPEGSTGELERRAAEVDSGIGCCMMYRRADALEAGGYDKEWSPVWFDDVDLCLKIRLLGRKVFFTPDVRAIHHFGHRWQRPRLRDKVHPRRFRRPAVRWFARRMPGRLNRWIEGNFDVDLFGYYTREQCRRLRHHHAYWRSRWGWDARNPDMAEIERRWGDTELWWARDPERRAAGERIVESYTKRRAARVARAGPA